jgi:hypothetical protein
MTTASRVFRAMRSIAHYDGAGAQSQAMTQLLLVGKLAADNFKAKRNLKSLEEVEFKVFSQFGDDGIIQWLTSNLAIANKTFIEFGVEDYRESNTRFLMMNDNWTGLVIDGSAENVSRIVGSEYYWKFELTAKAAFIDRENINALLSIPDMDPAVGILSIDLDGNDYWVLERINVVSPTILIVEYNSVFGDDRCLTIPYDAAFRRTRAHHSNLYWGASLPAFRRLCEARDYAFVGCNSAGNNAYFVRRDKLNGTVREMPLRGGFVASKFRESRDRKGRLTYLAGPDRLSEIRGLPIFNIETNELEAL